MKKKIGYAFLLIVVIAGIVGFFMIQGVFKGGNNSQQIVGMRNSNEINGTTSATKNKSKNKSKSNEISSTSTNSNKGETVVTTLDDGTLYSFTGKAEKADLVIGDNYFDTQINDIMLNYNEYKGKTVEIEGMYIDVYSPYTIIGRFSTNNLCAYCPAGYSGFEYIWDGDKIEATNEETWLKIIGEFCVGNDETSEYKDYYYIKANSIEVMNEAGLKTVSN